MVPDVSSGDYGTGYKDGYMAGYQVANQENKTQLTSYENQVKDLNAVIADLKGQLEYATGSNIDINGVIWAVISSPIDFLRQSFYFNIGSFNFYNLLMGIGTALICIGIIKKVIK